MLNLGLIFSHFKIPSVQWSLLTVNRECVYYINCMEIFSLQHIYIFFNILKGYLKKKKKRIPLSVKCYSEIIWYK